MHANRGGVEDGVERRGAQSSAGHGLSTESAREFPCGFFAARANGDGCAGTYQRKSSRPRGTTPPIDQDPAALDPELFVTPGGHAAETGVQATIITVATNK